MMMTIRKIFLLCKQKHVYAVLIFLTLVYFPTSLIMLTKYPIFSEDECWFSEVSYFFLKNGYFNSSMQNGLKEAVGGWVGHGYIYYIVDTISFWLFGVGLLQARIPMFLIGLIILFLVYKIAFELYGKRTAVLSIIIVALSDTFFRSSHAFEAHFLLLLVLLVCFYLYLILWKNKSNKLLPFTIGFLSAAAIEVHWIGTILPCVLLVLFLLGKKIAKTNIRNIQVYFFLLGGLVSFLIFFLFIRIYIIEGGWGHFNYKLNLYYGITESNSYIWSIKNEITRYIKYFSKQKVKWFELIIILVAIYYVIKRRNNADALILTAVGTYIFLMGLVVKNKNPYLILYIPLVYILISSVIDDMAADLMNLKVSSKIALATLCLIIPYFLTGIFYITFRYGGANYSQYVKDLKQFVPNQSTVMGWMPLWYGFYDQKFYENSFFVGRTLGRDLGCDKLKGTPDELYKIKHEAYLSFLKSKEIDYLILDENAKKSLISWQYMRFDNSENAFVKIGEVKSKFYGGKSSPKNPGYITEIYKVNLSSIKNVNRDELKK